MRQHGRRRRAGKIAERAFDHEPLGRQLGGAPLPHQKRHVTAGLDQPAAEIAADRAGADHEDTHRRTPFVRVQWASAGGALPGVTLRSSGTSKVAMTNATMIARKASA